MAVTKRTSQLSQVIHELFGKKQQKLRRSGLVLITRPFRLDEREPVMEISRFTCRTAVADLDCLAICPTYPDFLVYGTYSIIKRGEGQEYSAQVRSGSIQTLSVSLAFEPAYAGMLPPKLAQYKFSAAVLDIKFHPKDATLLGVALSNGRLHFFRFVKRADVLGRCVITELFPLGHAEVSAADVSTGIVPLVTQFQWFEAIQEVGRRDVSNTLTITAAATLSSGEVKILRAKLPGIKSTHDHRLALSPGQSQVVTEDVQSHSLEAWCTSILQHPSPDTYILLSGGDDSTLLVSILTVIPSSRIDDDLFTDPPTPFLKDTKIHSAGVTAILPLPPTLPLSSQPSTQTTIAFLTGSYDESIRLLTISPTIPKRPVTHTSLSLRGGVWRLALMDHYCIPIPPSHPGRLASSTASENKRFAQHYIILASCMHAGAKILRVTHSPSNPNSDTDKRSYSSSNGSSNGNSNWNISIEATFTKGHDTLVYACAFRREWRGDVLLSNNNRGLGLSPKSKRVLGVTNGEERDLKIMMNGGGGGINGVSGNKGVKGVNGAVGQQDRDVGKYTVVSAGFYDRQVCTWEWRDERRREAEC